jgi:hypothetical protein
MNNVQRNAITDYQLFFRTAASIIMAIIALMMEAASNSETL